MNQMTRLAVFALIVFVCCATPLFAQATGTGTTVNAAPFYGPAIAAGLGAGLTLIGAGIGFGKIGSAALESMARQPQVAGAVGTNMLIIAALLEGATFFSLVICIIMATAK
jgi:F-type H+-transporting ATPase subunit c